MLPRHRRLRRSRDFTTVVRTGARTATGSLVVHVARVGAEPARAGVIVGRGVGGAVVRNTVSRRLRHCLASVLADLPAGTVVVVRALPASAHVPTLCEEVSRGVTRAMRLVGQRGGTTPVMPS